MLNINKTIIFFSFVFLVQIEAQSILSIQSKPDSADVYINNELFGKTPIVIFNISDGYKSITLKKDSLKSWWTSIIMKRDSSDHIYAILDGDYGLLNLYTNPQGANVYLNDSLIGKSPFNKYEIKTGVYKIKIEKENYLTYEKFIWVTPSLINMDISLVSLLGSISFNNISIHQNIYLDGKLLNNYNLENFNLPIGNHGIQLIDRKLNKRISDNIEINSDNHYDVSFNYDEFSFKPLLYSSVIPGLGQIYSKSYLKGAIILISTLGSGYLTVSTINIYNKKTEDYSSFQRKYLAAETEENTSYYRLMTQDAYKKVNTASTYKNIAIGALVGVYLYNLLDAVLLSGNLDVMHFYEQKSQYEIKNEIGYNSLKMGLQWKF